MVGLLRFTCCLGAKRVGVNGGPPQAIGNDQTNEGKGQIVCPLVMELLANRVVRSLRPQWFGSRRVRQVVVFAK